MSEGRSPLFCLTTITQIRGIAIYSSTEDNIRDRLPAADIVLNIGQRPHGVLYVVYHDISRCPTGGRCFLIS
jgi:hypothetical protein